MKENRLPVHPDGMNVSIIGCNFTGRNLDGSDVFEYSGIPGGIQKIIGINMKGWSCYGPGYKREEISDETIEHLGRAYGCFNHDDLKGFARALIRFYEGGI